MIRCVIRGGSWISSPRLVRVVSRNWFSPYYRVNTLGFRILRRRL